MTTTKLNIAIANAIGIKTISDGIRNDLMYADPRSNEYNPNGVSITNIPNYAGDLNVMLRLWNDELGFCSMEWEAAHRILVDLVRDEYGDDLGEEYIVAIAANASAELRAKAFLKAVKS